MSDHKNESVCLQFITHPGEEQRSYTASPKKLLGQELPGVQVSRYMLH